MCIPVFREATLYYLLCSQLLKGLIKLPLESKGKGLDPKSELSFSEIVKNINKQHALISLKCFCSNDGILSAQLIPLHRVLYKMQDSILHFCSFFLSPYRNNSIKSSILFHTMGDKVDELNALLQVCFSPFLFLVLSRAANYSSVRLSKCTTMNKFTLSWIPSILLRTEA